jgi:HK97 family phage major capsid protein
MAKSIFELKQQIGHSLRKAESIMSAASAAGRDMTKEESSDYEVCMTAYGTLNKELQAQENVNTIRRMVGPHGMVLVDPPTGPGANSAHPFARSRNYAAANSPEYLTSLLAYLNSHGKNVSADLMPGADAAGGFHVPYSELLTRQRVPNGSYVGPRASATLYEGTPDGGSGSTGGFAVNVPTIQQIIPLALPDLGIYDASLVMPTATALKVPQQTAFGVAALKPESSGTIASFGGQDPTLGEIELDAWMAGAIRWCSFELMQDVPTFQQFVVDDLLNAQRILEDSLFANGTGVNQPQGVYGNTGNGSGLTYELTGTASDGQVLLDALFDVTATLKGAYQANASWIMSRATGLAIKRAQMQANLFVPVATTDPDGTERILGKPVHFDVNAPGLPSATSSGVIPMLYGDFRQGYLIGVRGGDGINVKILDQPQAAQGLLGVLAYRRIDAKVRLAEAIQQVKVSHS